MRTILTLIAASLAWNVGLAEVKKDIEFANVDGHSLQLDLHLPDGKKNPRLLVWIHGGGWRAGSKEQCELAWLTNQGFAVASISYRLTDKAVFPAQIHDCKGAVRWLRAHADEFGYRTEKIVVAGSSAGGHLAALLGTTGGVKELEGDVGGNVDQSSRVDAIVDYFGATDFIQRTKTQPHKTIQEGSIVRLLLGGPADQKVDLARLASSAFHVTTDDPPLLIFHGAKDNKVLIGQSERIIEEYRKAGLPVTLHVLENSGHGGKEFYQGENRARLLAFLKTGANGNRKAFSKTLFEDDFSGPGLKKEWGSWKSATVVRDGVMVGITPEDADHPSVNSIKLPPLADLEVAVSFQFHGSPSFSVMFRDLNYKGSHAGHICHVAVSPNQLSLYDGKTGIFRKDIRDQRKAGRKLDQKTQAELNTKISRTPLKLDPKAWHDLRIRIDGDALEVSIDGKATGRLQSEGIAHATKSNMNITTVKREVHYDNFAIRMR